MDLTIMPVGMLGTNCYILASEQKSCLIIDPGAQPDKIANYLLQNGLAPKYILLTHGHYDHIGAVKRLMKRYPDAELYMGEGDVPLLTDPSVSNALNRGLSAEDALFDHVDTIREGDTLTVDGLTVQVLETPGHSQGGLTFVCGTFVFAGDTLFYESVGRTDLYGGDFNVLKESLKKLCDLLGDYDVYPGHGESTTLSHERRHNPYINR